MYLVLIIASAVLVVGGLAYPMTEAVVAGGVAAALVIFATARMFQLKSSSADAIIDWMVGGTLAIVRDVGRRMEVLDWEMLFTKRVFLDAESGEIGLKKTFLFIPYSFWVRPSGDFRDIEFDCEAQQAHRWRYGGGRYGRPLWHRRGNVQIEESMTAWCNWSIRLVPRGGGPRVTLVDYSGSDDDHIRVFMNRINERLKDVMRQGPSVSG